MRVTPVNLEKILGRYIEEANIIYPSRVFRVVTEGGKSVEVHSPPDASRVNVEVDKHGKITGIKNYG